MDMKTQENPHENFKLVLFQTWRVDRHITRQFFMGMYKLKFWFLSVISERVLCVLWFQKFLKKEASKLRSSPSVIPNGQCKQPDRHNHNVVVHHANQDTSYNTSCTRHANQTQGGVSKPQPRTKASSLGVEMVNNVPLVCKTSTPVKRVIHVKPDLDIKVDINANSNIDEEKPKINGDLQRENSLNNMNNNKEETLETELTNEEELADNLDLESEMDNSSRGHSLRNSSRSLKMKKTRTTWRIQGKQWLDATLPSQDLHKCSFMDISCL